MGTIQHNVAIVTYWDEKKTKEAHAIAVELFKELVSPIIASTFGGYHTFIITSCGGKLGWEGQENHSRLLHKFCEAARQIEYIEPVFVSYGELGSYAADEYVADEFP